MSADLVNTATAARALGVHQRTLQRWLSEGRITPTARTKGGHARWNIEEIRQQNPDLAPHEGSHSTRQSSTEPEKLPVVAAIVTSHLGVLAGRRNDGTPPWTFIAGKIEPGESQADAAVREVKEETGLTVLAGEREIGRRVHPKTGRTMIYLACAPVSGTDVFVGDEKELAEVRWLSLDEAEELLPGMFEPVHEHLRSTIGQ